MSDVISESFQSDPAFFGAAERYQTPPTTPTGYRCRRIRIPDDLNVIAAVNELLSRLCFPEMWEERSGGLTPLEASVLANVMYDDYAESDGYCMIGDVVPVLRATLPPNKLWCDGSTYLRTDYPDLYAVLDSEFIVDADHFIVPDLRGRTVIGSNTDYPVNASGGAATHTLITGEMPSHTHTIGPHNHGVTDPGHTHTQNAHNHGVTDPGHTHTQNAHNHGVTDPGHTHTIAHTHDVTLRTGSSAGSSSPALASGSGIGTTTQATGASSAANSGSNTTGISTNNATPTNNSNTTGITTNNATPTNNSNTTGITINLAGLGPDDTGGGGAHNNMQPYRALKYAVVAK